MERLPVFNSQEDFEHQKSHLIEITKKQLEEIEGLPEDKKVVLSYSDWDSVEDSDDTPKPLPGMIISVGELRKDLLEALEIIPTKTTLAELHNLGKSMGVKSGINLDYDSVKEYLDENSKEEDYQQ